MREGEASTKHLNAQSVVKLERVSLIKSNEVAGQNDQSMTDTNPYNIIKVNKSIVDSTKGEHLPALPEKSQDYGNLMGGNNGSPNKSNSTAKKLDLAKID